MITQLNIKLPDEKTKLEAERLAKQLGFSLGSIMRAFLLHFIRTRRVTFSVEGDNDTPAGLTGAILEKALLQAGENAAYAKRHAKAYDAMLQAGKNGTLMEVQ